MDDEISPMERDLEKIMPADLAELLGVDTMTRHQKSALLSWITSVYTMGQHRVANIDQVKYDGHLVILDDGSRWEVDEVDTTTASLWDVLDKVLVADGEMWKLDESEKVIVTEET